MTEDADVRESLQSIGWSIVESHDDRASVHDGNTHDGQSTQQPAGGQSPLEGPDQKYAGEQKRKKRQIDERPSIDPNEPPPSNDSGWQPEVSTTVSCVSFVSFNVALRERIVFLF